MSSLVMAAIAAPPGRQKRQEKRTWFSHDRFSSAPALIAIPFSVMAHAIAFSRRACVCDCDVDASG